MKLECDLFAGFFTALNSVAKTMGVDSISSLVIDRTLYTFSKVFNLVFVIRTSTGARQEQVRKLLGKIKNIFFKHFPPEQYWEKKVLTPAPDMLDEQKDVIGYISFRQGKIQELDAEYEDLFADPLEKMKLSLWN